MLEEKSSRIVVNVVKRFTVTGVIPVVTNIEARQSVIVIRIKHTVVIRNADISVAVTILSYLGSVRYRLETVLIRLTVIDICVLFGSVICSR